MRAEYTSKMVKVEEVLEIRYRCTICDEVYIDEDEAEDCCKEQKSFCSYCRKDYKTLEEADKCETLCKEKELIERGVQKTLC